AHRPQRDHNDAARPCVNGSNPPPGRRITRRARQQENEERPHQQHGAGEVQPEGGEEEGPHSILNVKVPSVTSASIESTRHRTVYVPAGSGGSVARRRAGFARSTRLSRRSICTPRSF